MKSRDGGCRFPGCENRRWTDAHHIVHWAHGGETSAGNSIELCRRHHRLVHEGGFGVDGHPDGELRFWRPDGTLIETAPRSRGPHGARRRPAPLKKVRGNPASLGGGESFDLDLTVSLLAARAAERPLQPQGP